MKELREMTKMTQKEFGDYLNIPLRTIQNWETGHRTPPEYVVELIEYKLKKENENMKNKERNEWLQELLQKLKVGDLVAKNYGSFRKSLAYVVTEITDDRVICRLLRSSYSIEKIKMNKNYCSRDLIFELDKLGSFPAIIKLNLGYKDTDEQRKRNLENVWI